MGDFDPVLELKLCLLHECLTAVGAKEILSDTQYSEILKEVYKEKPLRSYVEDLASIDDNFSEDYIKLLKEIRIFLLG